MAAQTGVGLVLGALVWGRRVRPWPAAALLLGAIALAVAMPVEGDFFRGLGMTLAPEHAKNVLRFAAAMASVGCLVTRQWRLALVALLGEAALWPITTYIVDCDNELAAAHLAFFGLLAGLYRNPTREDEGGARYEAPVDAVLELVGQEDAIAFAIGTVAACLVCWAVLHGRTDSADEWGYTYQAALFAHLRAYGSIPHCSEALRSFYVFQYMGRSFAQYTPGWPLFMAPFVLFRVPWLAGPASLGVLAAGAARVARRAVAGVAPGSAPVSATRVRASGWFAVATVVLSSTVLINGASRYPHVFVAGLFAWALEALCLLTRPGLSLLLQRRWGAVLGGSSALLLAARPADGAALGFGLLVYFVYAAARRRVLWRGIGVALAVAAAVGALTLIILRLQLGVWFKTGYSLTEVIYPWNKPAWSLPKPNEYRWGLPLAAGAYCWWPASPAVGLAGIALLRGRERRMGLVFFCSAVALLTMYTMQELGRGFDFGYGPRYTLPLVVPMAVGTGVVFSELWMLSRSASGNALSTGGPLAVAMLSVLLGVVRIAPLVYPYTYADVHGHNRLHEAIEVTSPHNAVVFGGQGLNTTDPMDLTENLPLDLYPNQDVIIAIDRGPEETQCVLQKYRGRNFYRAVPTEPVRIVRY